MTDKVISEPHQNPNAGYPAKRPSKKDSYNKPTLVFMPTKGTGMRVTVRLPGHRPTRNDFVLVTCQRVAFLNEEPLIDRFAMEVADFKMLIKQSDMRCWKCLVRHDCPFHSGKVSWYKIRREE